MGEPRIETTKRLERLLEKSGKAQKETTMATINHEDKEAWREISWHELLKMPMPPESTICDLILETQLAKQALALWREWFEKEGEPIIDYERWYRCFFCWKEQSFRDGGHHAADCLYLRAKALVEE